MQIHYNTIFFKMLEVDDRPFKEMVYLLALVLIRKRYLKLKDFVSCDGMDYMEVQQKKDTPLLKVEVPLFEEENIAALRNKLSLLLDADHDSTLNINELRERIKATHPIENPCENETPGSNPPQGEDT